MRNLLICPRRYIRCRSYSSAHRIRSDSPPSSTSAAVPLSVLPLSVPPPSSRESHKPKPRLREPPRLRSHPAFGSPAPDKVRYRPDRHRSCLLSEIPRHLTHKEPCRLPAFPSAEPSPVLLPSRRFPDRYSLPFRQPPPPHKYRRREASS